MEGQQLAQHRPPLTAGDDPVQKAVVQQVLRPLKALGQLLLDGLLNHPGAGEADKCARFGQHDVPQRGEAGRHPTGGGVGEAGDVQPAPALKPLDSGGSLGHLHQRKDALLHPGSAAGGENHQGQPFLIGILSGPGDLLPHRRAHAAHEEAAVQHPEHRPAALNPAQSGHGPILQAGGLLQLLQLLDNSY